LRKKLAQIFKTEGAENAIFRNMAKLAGGDGLARIIGLLTTPVITRIYLPEHLGVLSVFVAIVSLMGPLGTFRYSLAIPLPKKDGVAANIVFLSLIVLASTTVMSFFVFMFFGSQILLFFSMEQMIPYWWLIPLAFAGTGIYELLSNWAVRIKAFYPLAKTKVWQKFIGAGIKISLGLMDLRPLGLLIGQVFTQAGGIGSLLRSFLQNFKKNLIHVTTHRIRFVSRRYADFPKFRAVSNFLLTFGARAPLLFFAWQFSAEITGQIGLALTMLSLPVTLIGTTTGKAFYAEIARIGKRRSDEILKITKSIAKKLILISLAPFFVLLLLGPWMFEIIFGPRWHEAGVFASILAVYLLAQFIYNPIGDGISNVFEKQSILLLIEATRLTLTLIVFLLAWYYSLNPKETLTVYSIALTIHYSFASFVVFRIIKKPMS
jgi:O-antigen/teichoic acid export membrane protein